MNILHLDLDAITTALELWHAGVESQSFTPGELLHQFTNLERFGEEQPKAEAVRKYLLVLNDLRKVGSPIPTDTDQFIKILDNLSD